MRVSQLNKLRQCAQVAAICYRVRNGDIEFLLVRTRGSTRWTFPKGSAEPGLTHAQAAALEAYEEAGVHGRIQETPFASYSCRKRGVGGGVRKPFSVNAHLCQVLRLGNPKEAKRNRTWFSTQEAKRCLREGRARAEGAELARVVERAFLRIQRLINETSHGEPRRVCAREKDALQKIQFEAVIQPLKGGREFLWKPYLGQRPGDRKRPAVIAEAQQKLLPGEVLQFNSGRKKV